MNINIGSIPVGQNILNSILDETPLDMSKFTPKHLQDDRTPKQILMDLINNHSLTKTQFQDLVFEVSQECFHTSLLTKAYTPATKMEIELLLKFFKKNNTTMYVILSLLTASKKPMPYIQSLKLKNYDAINSTINHKGESFSLPKNLNDVMQLHIVQNPLINNPEDKLFKLSRHQIHDRLVSASIFVCGRKMVVSEYRMYQGNLPD